MPFTSETASKAGKKSKRKKELGNDELRLELLDFSKELIDELKKKPLNTEQKLRLLNTILGYCMPKLKVQEIATTIESEIVPFNIKDLYKFDDE